MTTVTPSADLYDIVGVSNNGTTTYGFARISESGKISILSQFPGSQTIPSTNIVYGPDGNFYGVAEQPHITGPDTGWIYRFTPSGAYSTLLNFPVFPWGGQPAPLVAASDGNLYGTLAAGGTNGTGGIYQATLSGKLQNVASFPATGMGDPWTLMQGADGNLYGTTNTNYIFSYNLASHQLSMVYQMTVAQGKCACVLTEGMDGKLYGTAPTGGNFPGDGAVFSLDFGLPKPPPGIAGLYPSTGAVGQRVMLWGNYLLGATGVSFNGTPASSIQVTSRQSVQVIVPTGATTGPVTITTANGSATSQQNFTVQ